MEQIQLTGVEMLIGILIALSVIGGSLYAVTRLFVYKTQDILVRFILLIFTTMVALYVVDKVVAMRMEFIPEEQNAQLFDLIKTLVLMIFSYYFGTRENSNPDKGDENQSI